jgi:hypothetical protein
MVQTKNAVVDRSCRDRLSTVFSIIFSTLFRTRSHFLAKIEKSIIPVPAFNKRNICLLLISETLSNFVVKG